MKSVLALCCALALLGPGRQIAAQSTRTPIDVVKLGPQLGEPVPDFRLVDQTGRIQTLRSIMGPKGAMLVFYRSADW